MRSTVYADIATFAKHRGIWALLALGLSLAPGPLPGQRVRAQGVGEQMLTRDLQLKVGEQLVLDADGVKSFSEGIKGVIDVRLTKDNSKFVVLGQAAGKTTLLFIMMDGSKINHQIEVIDPNAKPEEKRGLVEVRDNIRLDFYFVQLSNNYSHNIGLAWPASIGGGEASSVNVAMDLQTGTLTSATAVVSQALPRLDLAQADGWAKLQRKASVITANGTQATFSGGGEVNVLVSGGFGGSIQQVSFGSRIGVLPLYDRQSGRIELQIDADVSDLTAAAGGEVPGRTTSTLKTVVNLELGQSIVLAGLSASNETAGQAGLPGLSQIPIIGVLFGTHNRTTSETENVVFIVPTVMDTVGTDDRRHISEALEAYEEFSGDFDDVKRPARFRAIGGRRRR